MYKFREEYNLNEMSNIIFCQKQGKYFEMLSAFL